MKIDKACYERGCACHDDRVDGETVEVVAQRTWVGLTDDDKESFWTGDQMSLKEWDELYAAVEAKLKEKNFD